MYCVHRRERCLLACVRVDVGVHWGIVCVLCLLACVRVVRVVWACIGGLCACAACWLVCALCVQQAGALVVCAYVCLCLCVRIFKSITFSTPNIPTFYLFPRNIITSFVKPNGNVNNKYIFQIILSFNAKTIRNDLFLLS